MKQLMSAEILFLNPADMHGAVPKLTELGFEIEYLDSWVDPCGPTVWINVAIASELDQDAFHSWVTTIVAPFKGDVVEAGHALSNADE